MEALSPPGERFAACLLHALVQVPAAEASEAAGGAVGQLRQSWSRACGHPPAACSEPCLSSSPLACSGWDCRLRPSQPRESMLGHAAALLPVLTHDPWMACHGSGKHTATATSHPIPSQPSTQPHERHNDVKRQGLTSVPSPTAPGARLAVQRLVLRPAEGFKESSHVRVGCERRAGAAAAHMGTGLSL